MPPCPVPQKTEQKKLKLPVVSAVKLMIFDWPGDRVSAILYAVIVNPCVTSVLVTLNTT